MHYSKLLTDILFPPRCPGCGKIIPMSNRYSYYEGQPEEKSFLHKNCRSKFEFNEKEYCRRCGTPVRPGSAFCPRCADGKRSFEEGRAVFLYRGSAKEAMLGVKYKSRKEYCEFFAFMTNQLLGNWIRSCKVDFLIPVPVHRKKKQERGYNQAEELALCLGRYVNIPVKKDVLLRFRNTKAQKELNPEERRMNLIDAFGIGKKLPEGSSVLLVDDIYTTGATMDMCAWKLKAEGAAARVYCLSMCVAVHV